jgi:predicted phage terminase large subunit-like protein
MVEMPPRHGKSFLCSQYFPAWYLGRNPEHRVILASYAGSFARGWGERARDALAAVGPQVFGLQVKTQFNRPDDWRIAGHTGRMQSVGMTGGITGRGANLLIIDDPIKDAIEASSEVYRQRAWDWYTSTARSRLEPDGVVIVIQTRWHQDDLIGQLRRQSEFGGEQWESLTLPAICEAPGDPLGRAPGDSLWPTRYSVKDLKALQDTIPLHWWNALYQQRPTPPGGSLAKAAWFPIVNALPYGTINQVRFWDCGGSERKPGSDPDYTVGAKLARKDDKFFISHIVRVQASSGDVDALIQQTAMMDGPDVPIREEQEPGSAGLAVINMRRKRLIGFNYRGIPSTSAKELRWQPLLVQAEVGGVSLVAGDWNKDFLAEVSIAPHGAHDDQLDATSGAFGQLTLGGTISARDVLSIGGGADELRSATVRRIF